MLRLRPETQTQTWGVVVQWHMLWHGIRLITTCDTNMLMDEGIREYP